MDSLKSWLPVVALAVVAAWYWRMVRAEIKHDSFKFWLRMSIGVFAVQCFGAFMMSYAYISCYLLEDCKGSSGNPAAFMAAAIYFLIMGLAYWHFNRCKDIEIERKDRT